MRVHFSAAAGLVAVFVLCLASTALAQGAKKEPPTEKQKIDRMIRAVQRQSSATFIGERQEYTPSQASAALQIRMQMDGGGVEFNTAKAFIDFVVAPNTHDVPYLVRFDDGASMSMKDYLTTLLDQIEAGKRPGIHVQQPTDKPKPAETQKPNNSSPAEPNVRAVDPAGLASPNVSREHSTMWATINRMNRLIGADLGWDGTKYVRWTHLGQRTHIWDKVQRRDRMDYVDEDGTKHVVVLNLKDGTGSVWLDGQAVTDPYTLHDMLQDAGDQFVNDRFWMFAPFMMRLPHTNLEYIRLELLPDDRVSHVIEVTFDKGTGLKLAPHEKYRFYIAHDTGLLEQWDCYEHADDIAPLTTTAWTDWQPHGSILLASQRGLIDGKPALMSDIGVYATMPESVFTDPAPPVLPAQVPPDESFKLISMDVLRRANADAMDVQNQGQSPTAPSASEGGGQSH